MDAPAGLQLAWFMLISCACALSWAPPVRRGLARLPRPLLWAAGAAVLARLVPSLLPMPSDALVQWDIGSYRAVAEAISQRRDVYDLTGRYPYLPLQMYAFAAAAWLSAHTPLPFLLLVKVPEIAADAALTALVGWTAGMLGRRERAPALAMVFALNPVSMLVTAYHGQFDSIPLTFLIAAWAVLRFRREPWALPLSALLFGLAVADKTWPLLLGPVLLWRLPDARSMARYAGVAAAVPLALLGLYDVIVPGGAAHALRVVTGYQGIVGAWGYSELLVRAAGPDGRAAAIHQATALSIWVLGPALGCAYLTAARLRRDPERMAIVLATVYAATAGWGVHWLAWLMPVALISGRRWSAAYTAAAGVYAGSIYLGFGGVFWVVVYVSGSLTPAYWSPTVGLVMWAGLAAAVLLTWGTVLGRELRTLAPSVRSRLARPRRPAPGAPLPLLPPPAALPAVLLLPAPRDEWSVAESAREAASVAPEHATAQARTSAGGVRGARRPYAADPCEVDYRGRSKQKSWSASGVE